MKILVINPPGPDGTFYLREGRCMHKTDVWSSILPPISIVLIGTILKNDGFNVRVIDSPAENIRINELKDIMYKEKYDLVFINTGTPTIGTDLYVAELAKSAKSSAVTVAFGIHVSALPEETFKMTTAIDIIIRGEPELTSKEIAFAVKNSTPFSKIQGISWRNIDVIVDNPDREYLKNLDILPIPDWSLVPYKKYILPLRFKPYFYIVISRGCPYHCSFCAQHIYYGRDVRLRSPEKIIEEIKFLKETYNVDDFMFWSDTFTIDRNHTVELCSKILEKNIKINWTTTTRIDLVDEELLTLMKKAGCWLIVHGIESGKEEQLIRMQKNITIDEIIKIISMEKRLGFKIIGHFIIGYPDENEKDIETTINFALELPIDFAQFYFATPFPGSELYDYCKLNNLLKTNNWGEYEQDNTIIKNKNLTMEKLHTLRQKAYRRFYLRPSIILDNLKYFIKPSGISFFYQYGEKILKFLFG